MSKPTNRVYKDLSPCTCDRETLRSALYVIGGAVAIYAVFFGAHILALWMAAP